MNVVYQKGQRIDLRPVEEADLPLFVRWMNDPEVTKTLAQVFPITMEWEKEWLKTRANTKENVVLLIVARAENRPIGSVGLHAIAPVGRHAVFGIQIGEKEYWNKGYGTEATELMLDVAFERLNLNRVSLDVYDSNARAIRVYERAGFQLEGVARQAVWMNGKYEDVRHYGLLAEEWRAKRSPAVREVCQT